MPPGAALPAAEPRDARIRRTLKHDLASRFLLHLQQSRLLPERSHLLVALSGGIDSVTLLHLLRFHAAHLQLRLSAAHFDHRMRNGSEADAAWVRGLCAAWGVPLHEAAAQQPLHSEAEARAARYAFLEHAAAEAGASLIVTAHQADDQAETVLFRLVRGSGLAGLAGIPARRGMIVRPLLPFRRADIVAWARAARLSHREDATNRDARYARNIIRHAVLPALERARPGATRAVLRLAQEAAAAEAAWNVLLDEVLEHVVVERSSDAISLARDRLLGYHWPIRARVLRRVLGQLGQTPGRAGTLALLTFTRDGASGRAVELAGGLRFERHFERFVAKRVAPIERAETNVPLVIPQPTQGRGDAVIGGHRVRVQWSDDTRTDPDAASFDPTAVRFPLELRAWQPGDRIRLAGGTRKLKKLFTERRVERTLRQCIPVLVQADGRVLWVSGVARAAGTEPRSGGPVFQIRVTIGNDG